MRRHVSDGKPQYEPAWIAMIHQLAATERPELPEGAWDGDLGNACAGIAGVEQQDVRRSAPGPPDVPGQLGGDAIERAPARRLRLIEERQLLAGHHRVGRSAGDEVVVI